MDAFRTGPEEGSARSTKDDIGGRANEIYSDYLIRISASFIDKWIESKSGIKSWS